MTPPRVLVTGAGGFAGGTLARRLAGAGESLLLLTRAGREAEVARVVGGDELQVMVRAVDWDEPDSVARAIADVAIDRVFHLAGRRIIEPAATALSESMRANVTPLVRLIEALANRPPGACVVVSTGEVYGDQPAPFQESQSPAPLTPYGASKACAEIVALAAWRRLGFPIVVARPAIVYGPHQDPVMFVPQLIEAALAEEPFAMSPGEQWRDLVYIDDLADALVALARTPACRGGTFNVGSGERVRLADLAARIAALATPPARLLSGARPYRDGEIMDYSLSIDRITGATGWRPATPLDQGLQRTFAWAGKAWRRPEPRRT